MAFGSTILLAGSGGSGTNIIISSDVADYNVLTAATAAGYDNSSGADVIIRVTINSGVNVTASAAGGTAFTTGALNANTTLTIINNGNIQGANGTTGGVGANGSSGGIGVYFNTTTGGSATHSIENNGTVSGGGGGGGGGGGRQGWGQGQDGWDECIEPRYYGSAGAVGALGAAGAGGGLPGTPPSSTNCSVSPLAGSGGAGGASLNKNGRTVSQSGSGTYNGSVVA
jgi:hypothetical protein|tara:strand:+ start:2644 stop:3324 length:681 start_codon:yes stop_codon:yes gene_type:complete